MSNPSSTPPAVNGPWRVLILDRDPDDPKWIVATVVELADVRPAGPGAAVDEMTTAWVAGRAGLARATLTPLPRAAAWRVDE